MDQDNKEMKSSGQELKNEALEKQSASVDQSEAVIKEVQSKNPLGESGSKGPNKILIVVGIIFVILVILGIFVVSFLVSSVKSGIDSSTASTAVVENELFDLEDVMENPETRDDYILLMLNQYQFVVAATAEDVSWQEYLVELDAFIAIVEELQEKHPDPLLDEAVLLFQQSRMQYEDAVGTVDVDDPEGEVDEEGIVAAGVTIGEAQEILNEYLDL